MGWEPICRCRVCGDYFDGYLPPGERVCECCDAELKAIEEDRILETAEQIRHERETNERAR